MSLPFGLLGLLQYRDSTGYELSKIFDESLQNFWIAQTSQIYRELDRMEKQGLVSSQSVIQEKKPNKRMYSITDDGRTAFREWLSNGVAQFESPHIKFLVRVFFGADAPEATLSLLKDCRDMCLSVLEELPMRVQPNIERYAYDVPDGENRRIYWEMTLDYGITQARITLEWAQRCIDIIERELAL
jgi:DNA-binding PadR family transcriptional regulator